MTGKKMQKRLEDRLKQYEKVVLIIACVFAVISFSLLFIMLYNLPKLLVEDQKARDLYENGIEVDAHIKSYYYNSGSASGGLRIGHFYIKYEYVDENNRSFKYEYRDPVACRTSVDRYEREQYIKQLIADGKTRKMLISDNGLCCLTDHKNILIEPKPWIVTISVISVSAIVLVVCIIGIVRRSKALRRFGKNGVSN